MSHDTTIYGEPYSHRRPDSNWTDARVELLKVRYAAGRSAAQIADELGGITRNAVICKVHRLGLEGRRKSPSSAPKPTPRPQPNGQHFIQVVHRVRDMHAGRYLRDENTFDRIEATDFPPDQSPCAVTLMQLNTHTCRWPLGDPHSPNFIFCGAEPIEALPYCGRHSRIAYQPATKRRRDGREFVFGSRTA